MSRIYNYNEYKASVKNLEKIFVKLQGLKDNEGFNINFDNYVKEFERIKDVVSALRKNTNNISSYQKYCEELDYIASKLDCEFSNIYFINSYSTKINRMLRKMDESNYKDVVDDTKRLIECVINFDSSNEKDEEIINSAFKTIYNVLLNEAVIDKREVCNYIIKKNSAFIRENVGSLITDNSSKEDLKSLELNNREEGLGYDGIDSNILKKIGSKSLSKKIEKYEQRRQNATSEFLNNLYEVKKEKDSLDTDRTNKRERILDESRYAIRSGAKALALIMTPMLILVGLWKIGGDEYKHTHIKKNVITNEQIGEEEVTYNLAKYLYKAEVKKISPWREKDDGKGYIRDITTYVYESKERTDSVDPYEIMKSMSAKEITNEEKDILYDDDNTTTTDIIITETIRDTNDYRHSVSTSLALIAAGLLAFGVSDYTIFKECDVRRDYCRYTYECVDEFISDLKDVLSAMDIRLTSIVTRERIDYVGNRIVKLRDEYHDINDKYGDINYNQAISTETLQDIKKYAKR